MRIKATIGTNIPLDADLLASSSISLAITSDPSPASPASPAPSLAEDCAFALKLEFTLPNALAPFESALPELLE